MRQAAHADALEQPGSPADETSPSPPPSRRSRRWPWLVILMLVAAGLAAVLAVGFGRNPRVVESVLLDRPAPPLAGPTLDGGTFDLADHRGKVVVVNVWASWCTVCREEHPDLEAAARRLAAHPVQFVGLNTQDKHDDAREFLEDMGGSSYPSVQDPDGRKGLDWGIFGVPETFVVDQRGRVRAKAVGAVTEQWLIANVGALVAERETRRS